MAKKFTPLMTGLIPPGTNLRTDLPVAAYYRQSGLAQVGNRSTEMQTADLPAELRLAGWSEDKIKLIDMDKGKSGQKAIDMRPGMKELYDLVLAQEIATVITVDESRLFRDTTMIGPATFADACQHADVMIITPNKAYDFNGPRGYDERKEFLAKCQQAADYIEYFIKGTLLRNRHYIIAAGKWAGGSTTPGYMVRLDVNSKGELTNHGKYEPFGPFAEVMNEYFRLFLSFAGNIYATYKQIVQCGPYYPDVEPPEGFKADYHELERYPSRSSLRRILVNPVYIGHWTHNGRILKYNNHPGIVPVDVFMKAFNYLSPVALDGETPNKHYRPFREQARPTLEKDRPVERPLYAGMLQTLFEGHWRNLGTKWMDHRYVYWLREKGSDACIWLRDAEIIDTALSNSILEKLRTTFEHHTWKQAITATTPNYEKERRRKVAQIESIDKQLDDYASRVLQVPEDFVPRVVAKIEDAQAEQRRLKAELAALDDENARIKALEKLKEDLGPALDGWTTFSREKKRIIAQRLIKQIQVIPEEESGTTIIIFWTDNRRSGLVLRRKMGKGKQWTKAEQSELLSVVTLPQQEIAARFPDRTWHAIREQLLKLTGTSVIGGPKSQPAIREDETYDQYMMRVSSTFVRQSSMADRSGSIKPFDISALLASYISSTTA